MPLLNQATYMPQVRHHPDDIMRKHAFTMTKTSSELTLRPAVEMKLIRVSTCLCNFHPIWICKLVSPIGRSWLQTHTLFVDRVLRNKSESPLPLGPPSQTRCLGRSNTGRSIAVLLHSYPVQHISCASLPKCLGFTIEQRTSQFAPSW